MEFREIRKDADELNSEELEECYLLARRLRKMYLRAGEKWSRPKKLEEMRDTPEMEYYLLQTEDDEIVAYVSFVLSDEMFGHSCLYIWELHVANAYKRQGLATKLVNVVKTIASNADTRIFLRCFSFNTDAIGFYKSQGFKEYTDHEEDGSIYFCT